MFPDRSPPSDNQVGCSLTHIFSLVVSYKQQKKHFYKYSIKSSYKIFKFFFKSLNKFCLVHNRWFLVLARILYFDLPNNSSRALSVAVLARQQTNYQDWWAVSICPIFNTLQSPEVPVGRLGQILILYINSNYYFKDILAFSLWFCCLHALYFVCNYGFMFWFPSSL